MPAEQILHLAPKFDEESGVSVDEKGCWTKYANVRTSQTTGVVNLLLQGSGNITVFYFVYLTISSTLDKMLIVKSK